MAGDGTFELVEVPVSGGALTVGKAGSGGPAVLAIHGVTASLVSFGPIASLLPEDITFLAPDLRGRGGSAGLPGPFGMGTHVDDCIAVLDHLGIDKAIVVGMSMGGFVATVMATRHPERVASLVLIDGGIPLPIPEGVDADQLIDAVLGPAVERLRRTFESPEAYLDFWRVHPAFTDEGAWTDLVEAYIAYDLTGTAPEFRSKVSEDAMRADSRDLLTNSEVPAALGKLSCPVTLLCAERGLQNEPAPLYWDELIQGFKDVCPQLEDERVPDTNHYTIALAKGAPTVAQRIEKHIADL